MGLSKWEMKFGTEFGLVHNNSFIINQSNHMQLKHKEEFAICVQCANPIEKCVCVCPFCGERDKCECALFDAATGG